MWIKDHSGGQWGICQNYFGADFTLSSFSISAVPLTTNVWLRWTAPTSCGFSNNTVYIRWSTITYPATTSDGIEVYTGTNTLFEHTSLDNSGMVTNYYTIWGNDGFPYTDLGANNHASACPDMGRVRLFWQSLDGFTVTWMLTTETRNTEFSVTQRQLEIIGKSKPPATSTATARWIFCHEAVSLRMVR